MFDAPSDGKQQHHGSWQAKSVVDEWMGEMEDMEMGDARMKSLMDRRYYFPPFIAIYRHPLLPAIGSPFDRQLFFPPFSPQLLSPLPPLARPRATIDDGDDNDFRRHS